MSATPGPSKRAKSSSALDMRYGRGGGRRLPTQSDYEQARNFDEAVTAGQIVRAMCFCTVWWLVLKDVESPCGHCGYPMVRIERSVDEST